jgi:DNA-binding NarL/FixJ family response regulator
MQGYWTALRDVPDVIAINLQRPDRWVRSLITRLRAHSLTQTIPVLIFNPQEDPATESELLALGATGYRRQALELKTLLKDLDGLPAFHDLTRAVVRAG